MYCWYFHLISSSPFRVPLRYSAMRPAYTIDLLAEKFYISKFHMMRRFREETGSSVHTYLSDRRLLLARDMIRNGTPATDACFHCGFRSYSSFSRAYGKLFGTTPTGRTGGSVPEESTYE